MFSRLRTNQMNNQLTVIPPAELVRQSSDVAGMRFDAAKKILSKCTRNPLTNCWEFTGHRDRLGYGKLHFNGRNWLAHRLSYFATYGELPKGLLLCHQCDNPSCCNPHHIFLGTDYDNTMDAVAKGRKYIPIAKGENHSQAKLTESQVLEIRTQAGTISQRLLGEKYGISQSVICNIIKRKIWRNI